jgi:hypothetical protein
MDELFGALFVDSAGTSQRRSRMKRFREGGHLEVLFGNMFS